MYVCVCMCVCTCHGMCRGQRTTFVSWSSLSILGSRDKTRLLDLPGNCFLQLSHLNSLQIIYNEIV